MVISLVFEMVMDAPFMGTPGISIALRIVFQLGLAAASASVMGSGVVLQVKYAQCSLATTVPSAPKPSYVQVI